MIRFHLQTLLTSVMVVAAFGAPTSVGAQSPKKETRISAPLVYEKTMLVFVADDGVGAAIFRPTSGGAAAYDFRFEGKDGTTIEKANVPLFEARKPDGALGGELFIKTGPISIEWSRGSEDQGWIYYVPEKVKVYLANADDFGDRIERVGQEFQLVRRIDLQRFVKPSDP